MPDEEIPQGTLESPPTNQPDDHEPEGTVDVQGKKMVPVAALVAERERATKKTEEKLRAEFEPTRHKAAQADQLAADLEAARPYLEHIQQHPEILQTQSQRQEPQISDDEAEKVARDYELYTANGLDLPRARRILAKQRTEITFAAQEAARQVIQPVLQGNATQAARQNFIWAATQKGPDGHPLVDPTLLANVWARVPPELAQHQEVARHLLQTAIGEAAMSGHRRPAAPTHDPTFTEAPGGGRGGHYQISDIERKVARTAGINEKDWTSRAQAYRPDAVNVLGD